MPKQSNKIEADLKNENPTDKKAELVKKSSWMKNVITAEKVSIVVFFLGTVGCIVWMAAQANPNYRDEGFQSTVFSCFTFFALSVIDLFREKSKLAKLEEELKKY